MLRSGEPIKAILFGSISINSKAVSCAKLPAVSNQVVKMSDLRRGRTRATALALWAIGSLSAAPGHTIEPSAGSLDEIIVTAEKWEQAADTVGMPITAVSGEVLLERGIASVADLTRLVPGLTAQQSSFNSTSLTLRGVGFYNSDIATPPAVTIYVDEAPLPYPAMTKLAAFDLARVEVLKGPQGTLFGQNATGGAVNYIAAKPTEVFAAGMDASYGRFNRLQVGGFVSGPISDQLQVRLAVQGERGDGWQESVTRSGDELGRIRELQVRAAIEWHPDAKLESRLTLTSTYDGSDSLAGQFLSPVIAIPSLAVPGLLTFPAIDNPRAADWSTSRPDTNTAFPYASDTTLFLLTWRNELRPAEGVTFTSLTSYASFHMAYGQDPSGTPYFIDDVIDHNGKVSDFYQELRVASRQRRFNWLLGVNHSRDDVKDEPLEFFGDEDLSHIFANVNPQAYGDESMFPARLRAQTEAVFGRLEFNVSDRIVLEGGVRYDEDRRTFDNCSIVVTDHFASFWNLFRGGAQPPTQVGDCYVLDPANGLQPVNDVHNILNQDSLSWRTGLDWTPRERLLLYANVSKGFKAGAAPVLAASTVDQFKPVPQESLLAYEAGFKSHLFDRRVQFNASAFYYDYKDKQLRGAELDPTFGPLEALVSIPKSHVDGAEAELTVRPIEGLTLDTSATYVHTEIDEFTGFNALARFGNQAGTPFPFAPKWVSIANLDYEVSIVADAKGFIGGSLTYNSKTYAGVGALDLMRIDSFALLDLRAGVDLDGGRLRVWLWGRNVTNKYYWNNVFANGDAIARFVGEPALYGVGALKRF